MRWAWRIEKRNAYKAVIEKSEGKRSLERSLCSYENNMKLDLKK
jgi:hypothetical protein